VVMPWDSSLQLHMQVWATMTMSGRMEISITIGQRSSPGQAALSRLALPRLMFAF